ncbi:MAG TPA: lysophospholipid acyltransferase family protein [Pirellulaceae bacterium]
MTGRQFADRCWYTLIWCHCWVFARVWFRLRTVGRSHVPATGPVMVVSNHQSHLDPVLLGVSCPRQLRAMARKSLFFWPLGWLIRSLGAVPVDRGGRGISGIKAILKMLSDQDAVIVFAEGTRTHDGQLQAFQSGFAALARRSGATIVPTAISGAYEAMPRGRIWPSPRPVAVAYGAPIAGAEIDDRSDEQLVELVHVRIAAMLAELHR